MSREIAAGVSVAAALGVIVLSFAQAGMVGGWLFWGLLGASLCVGTALGPAVAQNAKLWWAREVVIPLVVFWGASLIAIIALRQGAGGC